MGLGGALGAVARWWLASLIAPSAAFPVGIAAVNLCGCLLIGFLFPYTMEKGLAPAMRLGIVTGFIGAFTTFSTWEDGTYGLLVHGAPLLAGSYLLVSLTGGLACVAIGAALAQRLTDSTRRRKSA